MACSYWARAIPRFVAGLRALQCGLRFDHRDLVVDAGFIEVPRVSSRDLCVRLHSLVENFCNASWPRISKEKFGKACLLGQSLVLQIGALS